MSDGEVPGRTVIRLDNAKNALPIIIWILSGESRKKRNTIEHFASQITIR